MAIPFAIALSSYGLLRLASGAKSRLIRSQRG
jgi:hypothetical protein